ncbi:MAG: lytic transglycosylase, partial [Muribaculaceae bacterium]|nr:lytic transglycosylase [Muribaculaceae bacterium]
MTFPKKLLSAFCFAAASLSAFAADNILSIRDTIKDPNLVYPESYEADVHNMRKNWYIQNYILLDKKVDKSADVVTTDAQYIERLKKMPTAIEMPFNEVVKSYIEMYTGRKRGLVETMLGMSTYYMPIFEEALEREGMPLEL